MSSGQRVMHAFRLVVEALLGHSRIRVYECSLAEGLTLSAEQPLLVFSIEDVLGMAAGGAEMFVSGHSQQSSRGRGHIWRRFVFGIAKHFFRFQSVSYRYSSVLGFS